MAVINADLVQAAAALIGNYDFVLEQPLEDDWYIEVAGIKAHEELYAQIQADAEILAQARENVLPNLTPRQIRLMMLQIGLNDAAVEQQIAMIYDPQTHPDEYAAAMTEWQWAGEYRRDHPLVNMLGTAMDFESYELDALWAYAAQL